MSDPTPLNETSAAYVTPADATARPEPWSHQWHDELGLLYHRASAEKIRRQPELRRVAVDNIDRWMERNAYPPSVVRALTRWRVLLTTASLDELLAAMTDPSEDGHQRRQNTPFAGVLTQEERLHIREAHEKTGTP